MQTLYLVFFSVLFCIILHVFLTGMFFDRYVFDRYYYTRRREWVLDGAAFITTWTAGHYLQYLDAHGLLLPPLTPPNGSETAVTDDTVAVAEPLSVNANGGSTTPAKTPPPPPGPGRERKTSLLGRLLRSVLTPYP